MARSTHDEEADFDLVYRRYAPAALRRARRLLGDAAEADEVIHDVFLRLLEHPQRFRGDSALSTYLYSAVTHACFNQLRNAQNRRRLLERFRPPAPTPPESPAEIGAELRSALLAMPEPLAEVAVYFYMDGLTHEEIAELIGCSRRQVGNHITAITRWASREELRACRI
ncbi:MAG: sigma-70 family RNA polymerase sigma factor [Myxococcales bacterium]|nr:sigma-70 family RNA polymerase sigma factor [Myxococcales bacterium]